MNSLKKADIDSAVFMCFAEQRILLMCIAVKNRRIKYLLDSQDLVGDINEFCLNPQVNKIYFVLNESEFDNSEQISK